MFNKLIGQLFARANARRKQRYVNAQQDTTALLQQLETGIANAVGRVIQAARPKS
jgi:hypothetical protein